MKLDLSAGKYYILGLALFLTVLDLLLLSDIYSFVILPVFLLWLCVFISFNLRLSHYIYTALGLLLCIPILNFLTLFILAEKLSIYAYLFLILLCIKEFRMLSRD